MPSLIAEKIVNKHIILDWSENFLSAHFSKFSVILGNFGRCLSPTKTVGTLTNNFGDSVEK